MDLAIRAFATAVRHGWVDLKVWHLRDLPEVTAVCLAAAHQLHGEDEQSRAVLVEALRQNPGSQRLRRRLIDACVKLGQEEDAIDLAGELPIAPERREALHTAIRGACKAVRQDWTAALGHLQSAYLAGCDDPICLRWLSVTYLSNGQVDAAEPVLRQWHQAEPDNPELQAYLGAVADQRRATAGARPADADASQRTYRVDEGQPVPGGIVSLPPLGQPSSTDAGRG
jgi:Flp pilus assembly protein TadD